MSYFLLERQSEVQQNELFHTSDSSPFRKAAGDWQRTAKGDGSISYFRLMDVFKRLTSVGARASTE